VKLVTIPAAREMAIATSGADWIAVSRLAVRFSIIKGNSLVKYIY
jgi:hypothetical protein